MSHIDGSGRDARDLVQDLRACAAAGKAVAAARPRWPDLGRVLLALQNEFVVSVWEGDESGGKRATQRPLQPLQGTPGQSPGTPNLNPDNRLVVRVANTSVTAVRDHLLGFANLCASDGPARTLLVVSRVLLDASAHVLWLLDPAVDERIRAVRAANVWFEASRQELGDPISTAEKQRLSRHRDDLIQAAITDSFQRVYAKSGAPQHQLAPTSSQDAVLSAALGDKAQTHWRAASSVAHAQERPNLRFALGIDDIDPGPHATSLLMTRVMILLVPTVRAIQRIEEFYGIVGTPVSEEAINRVLSVGAFGSGMHDDIIQRDSQLL